MLSLSYIAGFFDADGAVSLILDKRSLYSPWPRVQCLFYNNNKEILEKIQSFFGFGKIYITHKHPEKGWKVNYRLVFSGRQSDELLEKIIPYLNVKRVRAELALETRSLVHKRKKEDFETCNANIIRIVAEVKRLNQRGVILA